MRTGSTILEGARGYNHGRGTAVQSWKGHGGTIMEGARGYNHGRGTGVQSWKGNDLVYL
jgi:hypothetical protein